MRREVVAKFRFRKNTRMWEAEYEDRILEEIVVDFSCYISLENTLWHDKY